MKKIPSLSNKIRKEFAKNDMIKLADLYSTLSQDKELEHVSHLKHRIRSTLYGMKKVGKIKLIDECTYQLIKSKD